MQITCLRRLKTFSLLFFFWLSSGDIYLKGLTEGCQLFFMAYGYDESNFSVTTAMFCYCDVEQKNAPETIKSLGI
jgi:hypothetical protein